MAQDMTFAQALSEARQIIVQQSSRIKGDLEKIMALQDTIANQSTTISQSDRIVREQAAKIAELEEQRTSQSAQLQDVTNARSQAESIIDRQGQRLTQSQATIETMQAQLAEQADTIDTVQAELDNLRQQLPTQEDTDALTALAELLVNKKVSVPAAALKRNILGETEQPTMRLTQAA